MKLILAIILFILCILKKRSKPVFVLTMVGLWYLMTYCGETLDSQNYINEFNNFSLANAAKEPLYILLLHFFKSLGFSYEAYHAISSAIAVTIIGLTTYKLAYNYNLVLGLFLIYPFALYVVQIRNCFAFSICMIAFVFLNKNNNTKTDGKWFQRNKNEIIYLLLIACASLVHSAYIVFFAFVLAEKFDLKKVVITTAIMLVAESVVLNKTILLNVAELFNVRERLEYILLFQSTRGQSDVSFRVIATFVMYLCVFWYLIIEMKAKYGSNNCLNMPVYRENMVALKLNIMCLIIIPVIPLMREMFRIQEAIMLMNYIVITNNMDTQHSWTKTTYRNVLILALLLMVIFVDDFLYILRFESMREYVLRAVFG